MDTFQKQVKTAFLEESSQLLLDAEQQFLTLQAVAKIGALCPPDTFDELFRLAHNIKGSANIAGFPEVSTLVHGIESLLGKIRSGACNTQNVDLLLEAVDRTRSMFDTLKNNFDATFENKELIEKLKSLCSQEEMAKKEPSSAIQKETSLTEIAQTLTAQSTNGTTSETVRINLDRLDTLVKRTGELMVLRMALAEQSEVAASLRSQVLLRELEKLSIEVHQGTMNLRMAPIRPIFQNMNRIVRETSKTLNKNVKLELIGDETELDRTVLERITDPLVHLMRNAVDHGIEDADSRKKSGKLEEGLIQLSARQDGRGIIIEIQDDGKGLNPELLVKKGIEKGILTAGATLTPEAAYQLIFAPGFSTKTDVTEISGRGVGMDVVKSSILKLRGSIQIRTELGKGTCFTIRLPLTLAVLDGLVIRVGNDKYVLPCSAVTETIRTPGSLNPSSNSMEWNGKTLPLYRLNDLLGKTKEVREKAESITLVTRDHLNRPISLLVDGIEDQQSIVVQKLDQDLELLPWIMGGAILGDGQPSLILNLHSVLEVAS